MRLSRLVPASFIYIQGLSLLNPIYVLFSVLFIKNIKKPLFRPGQTLIFFMLLICQFLAIWMAPHQLPTSAIATVIGLFAFTVRPEELFSWDDTEDMRRSYRNVLALVMLAYLIDSLLRVQYIQFNWSAWSDYEFKEWVKTNTWLADDTNTLGIRVILLYFIARSIGFMASTPWLLKAFVFYLTLTSYSRAALVVLLLVFAAEVAMRNMLHKKTYVLTILAFAAGLAFTLLPSMIEEADFDSSVISKLDLLLGSFGHWLSSDWWERLLGGGYYSNVDVGIANWASGHSIAYYAMVDFGVLGSIFLGALIVGCAHTARARWLIAVYSLLGLAVFRFDFLFLYVTLFFVEYVAPSRSEISSLASTGIFKSRCAS